MAAGSGRKLIRPQTAATTTRKDELRIKKQLQYLEVIERKIEDDIDLFNNQRKPKDAKDRKGIKLTKKMLFEASQCDSMKDI